MLNGHPNKISYRPIGATLLILVIIASTAFPAGAQSGGNRTVAIVGDDIKILDDAAPEGEPCLDLVGVEAHDAPIEENKDDNWIGTKYESASGYKTTTLSFNVDPLTECSIHDIGNGYQYLEIEGLKPSARPGEPLLPVKTFKVKLPLSSEVYDVDAIGSNYMELDSKINIVPGLQPLAWDLPEETEGKEASFGYYDLMKPNMDIYSMDTYYPGEIMGYDIGSDNEHTYVFITLYPVQYIPSEQKAVVVRDITVNIKYMEKPMTIQSSQEPYMEYDDSESIIITPPELLAQALDLEDFHENEEGITTLVVETTWINDTYSPAEDPPYDGYNDPSNPGYDDIHDYDYWLAKKIISYLRDTNSHPNLQYVTLLGNGLNVPPSYYIYNDVGGDYDSWLPTDFFYSSPDYDYTPNYLVGRLTADDANEADHIVQKIRNWYDNVVWEWFRNVVVSGGDPFWTVPYVGELICVDSINRESFAGMNIEKQFLTDGTCNDAHMEDSLSSGDIGFVYHIGHGSGNTMWLDSGSVSADEVLNFNPISNTSIVVSIACDNGAFDTNLMTPGYSGPSFGEAVLASDAAGVAYIGGSRTNYGMPDFYFDDGNLNIIHEWYMAGMLTYLFEEYHNGADSLGSLAMNAMARFSAEEDMGDFYTYRTFFEFTLLGDPALLIPIQQATPGYQLPYSNAQDPSGYDGNDIPYYEIPEGYEITIESTTDSPNVVSKLVEPFYYQTLDYEANSTTGNTVQYKFIPQDETYYEARTITDDAKERWLYVLVEEFIATEHDILVSKVEGPAANSAQPGELVSINATVKNMGTSDETDITVQFLVNGGLTDEQTIPSISSGSSTVLTFYWSSSVEGIYDIMVRALPVPDENNTDNNEYSIRICITNEEARRIVILDSWGTDYSSDACWDALNGNWMDYGTTPIDIDYISLNKNDISYQNLVNAKADVLLISCAFAWEFTDAEIDAITQYLEEGHGFIATAATLYDYVPNNNKLAPLFGMRDDIVYDVDNTLSLDLLDPTHQLFINIPDPYQMATDTTCTPPDFSWDADDLTEGTYVALSPDGIGAIIVNNGLAYITHWVEYLSNNDDMQLLYNAMIWSRYEQVDHDVAVLDLQAPDFIKPSEQTYINATVRNLGLNDEFNVLVEFAVNGTVEDNILITVIGNGSSMPLSFPWTAPADEGNYVISIEAISVPDEVLTKNNKQTKTILVTEGVLLGKIALISDNTELVSIKPILDGMGKTYEVLSDNILHQYTSDLSTLIQYQMIIFYNSNRAIDAAEYSALRSYIDLGGSVVATGINSLSMPKDTLLGDVLGVITNDINLFDDTLMVWDDTHPIVNGPYGQFPNGYTITGLHDNCNEVYADIARGAMTVAKHTNGDDKITVFENGNGRAVYWDGSGPYDWSNDVDAEAMFKNLILWILPTDNDVGVVSISCPVETFVGEAVNIGSTVVNYGNNDQSDFEVLFEVKNSIFITIYSEIKTGISLSSWESSELIWQWSTTLSDIYTIEISTLLASDEITANDRMFSQITVYIRFFSDDMESGAGDWDSTSSSLARPPLWHQTTSDSYSPTTSWWCGQDITEQYTVWADQYLVSPFIDLTEARSAFLRFCHKYSIDDFPIIPDWGRVEINPGGSGWEELVSYSGTWLTWSEVTLDLSDYLGEIIQIRFTLSSGVFLTDNGWWVDDVEIFGIGNQYGIDLNTDANTIAVGEYGSAVYDIIVRNIGNAFGTAELSFDGTGMEGWIMTFSPEIFSLLPGESKSITLTVMPVPTEHGDYPFTVTGDLKVNSVIRASDILPLVVTVNQWYGVDLVTQNDQLDFVPSETNHFNITVINQGNGQDTILLSTEDFISGVSTDWQFEISEISVSLDAFQQEDVTLYVTAPPNGYPDDSIVINVIGTSLGDASRIASLTTTSLIIEFYSIELHSSQTEGETEPGIPISYEITVSNQGNTQVNVDLDISPGTGSWDGWNGVLSTKNFLLSAFASKDVTLSITPPGNALAFEYKECDIRAISTDSSSIITIKTNVALSGGLNVDVDDKYKEGGNGESIYYFLTLTNFQNIGDTFDITFTSKNGWNIVLFEEDSTTPLSDSNGGGKPDTRILNPWNGREDMVVCIEIPENGIAFTTDEATITFTSSQPNGDVKSILLTTEIELSGSFILSADSYSNTDTPGMEISYLVNVKNSLNYEATIDLIVSSKEGWDVRVFDEDGSTHLLDSNDNGIPDTGKLNALGESRDITVVATIPENAVAYTKDIITLTATSSPLNVGQYSIELNATVERVYDIEISLEGDLVPAARGQPSIYSLKLSNSGNYGDTMELRFSELPDGWRADFSQSKPYVPMGSESVITITLDVPSDAEPGDYLVVIKSYFEDGTPSDDLILTIEVVQGEEDFEFPFILLLLLLIIICAVIASILMIRRRNMAGETPGDYGALPRPSGYQGPTFASIEMTRCPNCYNMFEAEVEFKPFEVQCPRCGVSGMIR